MSVRLVIKPVQAPAGILGTEFPLDVDLSVTVEELKEQVAGRTGLPKGHIRLVCAGRIWQDTATVGSYQPQDGTTVHCLNNPPRATPAASEQTLASVDPLQMMMGTPPPTATPTSGGDPFQQMMSQAQQQMMQNPEMMQQLMGSPMVQQMLSNPETVRTMMRMNPQLNQLMEQRPEIARLLEDPEVLQQSMRMIANPSLMREMTRNADRAIGQLDAMPGGHNALLQAHEDFVDPLFEAMAGGGSTHEPTMDNVATYTQPTSGGPNNAALPNPWGASAPAPTTSPTPMATPAPGNPGGANPMAAMMQQMLGGNPRMAGTQQPASTAAGASPFPGAAQQLGDPAQMQQVMAMAQQLMGGRAGAGLQLPGAAQAPTAPSTAAAALAALGTPASAPEAAPVVASTVTPAAAPALAPAGAMANPMATMLHQMMNGGAGMSLGAPTMGSALSPTANISPAALNMQRMRFAAQLAQLTAMGFSDEAACLRALAQHGGRVDAAIDTLLASGEGSM